MPDSSAVILYMTVPSLDEGKRIIRFLLEEKCIACANIFPPVTSLYRWEGEIQETAEIVIIAKTLSSQVERTQKRIKQLHPYACPLVLTVPLGTVPPALLSWFKSETGA